MNKHERRYDLPKQKRFWGMCRRAERQHRSREVAQNKESGTHPRVTPNGVPVLNPTTQDRKPRSHSAAGPKRWAGSAFIGLAQPDHDVDRRNLRAVRRGRQSANFQLFFGGVGQFPVVFPKEMRMVVDAGIEI